MTQVNRIKKQNLFTALIAVSFSVTANPKRPLIRSGDSKDF